MRILTWNPAKVKLTFHIQLAQAGLWKQNPPCGVARPYGNFLTEDGLLQGAGSAIPHTSSQCICS